MDITATAGGISIGTMGTTTATIIIIATKPEETRRVERAGSRRSVKMAERGSKPIRAFVLELFRHKG